MKEMIINFITMYGWQLALIACGGIFVLGVLKFFDVFKKISKDKRKYLYAGISSLLSIIGSAIYLIATGGFEWASFGVISGAIYGLNQTIYALYENTGVRAVLRELGTILINFVAKKQLAQAKQDIVDDINKAQEVKS